MKHYENPTVRLALEIPRKRGVGDWEWAPCPVIKPVDEYAYTGPEVCRLLSSYGRTIIAVANTTDPQDFPRVRFVARGLITGRTLGTHEWVRNPDTGHYEPDGDPMITLPPIPTWPDVVIRGWSVMTGRTGGKPCASCPHTGPEWRAGGTTT
ncbi:hypothetical protein [Kitasatospora cathayae]|uniref:Uncharacterized protein n=1 Tax=Kitasatospora cathayae TaxID=3004092 RepID=A0ABY7Q2U1_9ACTN|nr:hypothetical protein [Kitasatospora sp. HUAS 3-15]WBP87015.1 hypothetical protein O1G21_14975 [Kitasatospora sp. HUAS 3-15]